MSVGLGIFLSSLVFALILLYLITRDRWNWRRIGVGALVGGCLIGVVVGGIYAWNRLTPVSKQTEYAGLRLGMTMDEIKYIKGVPTDALVGEETGEWKDFEKIIAIDKLENGKKIEDYNDWPSEGVGRRIDLDFDKSKLIRIRCYSGDKLGRCPPLGGIRDGDSEQQVVNKFGRSYTASIDGVTKKMWYSNIGAFFYLTQETVHMLGVIDTNYEWRK
jgi:hypothetical protein